MENHEENRKQEPRNGVPVTELNEVSSDFAIAVALQEQDRVSTMLTTIDSESSDVDESDESASNEETFDNNYEYFDPEFEDELELFEEQDSNSEDEDEMDEDDDGFDVDELTYEELIELGEFIGQEKRGLSLNEISKCLRPYRCSFESKMNTDRCVICQVEYEERELVVALPCDHPYHSECISNWLQVKKICPICSTEVSPPTIAS